MLKKLDDNAVYQEELRGGKSIHHLIVLKFYSYTTYHFSEDYQYICL